MQPNRRAKGASRFARAPTELGTWRDRGTRMDAGGLLTLYGRAVGRTIAATRRARAIFQALPGLNVIANTAATARDGALVTGAAQASLASGWPSLAKFDGEFSSATSVYSGSGMVKKTWRPLPRECSQAARPQVELDCDLSATSVQDSPQRPAERPIPPVRAVFAPSVAA
jgi:hypothetical protein